jgi:hypothetical protein
MKGHALHIGINYCNPRDAADCQLDGAIPDALALRDATDAIAYGRLNGDGTLLEEAATEEGILGAIANGAATVRAGELLVITFSGLGVNLDLDMTNPLETLQRGRVWVSYDGGVINVGEVLDALSGAPKGARVLVVSACCFLGPQLGTARRQLGARVSSARFNRALRAPDVIEAAMERMAARKAACGRSAVLHALRAAVRRSITSPPAESTRRSWTARRRLVRRSSAR